MRFKTILITMVVFMTAFFMLSASSFAGGIKARMKARLPEINNLKAAGIIGENNRGYLEFVGAQTASNDLVAAENQDREAVYKAIAQQQGSTSENVGKRRAIKLADNARPGEWLQDAKGKWYRK